MLAGHHVEHKIAAFDQAQTVRPDDLPEQRCRCGCFQPLEKISVGKTLWLWP